MDPEEDMNVKLYETKNEPARYICLSHCWGKTSLIRTERATVELYKSSIPWSALSKTFQDAVTFTRSLNVRYLWIDSLCIIQDDRDDWRREASKMASIYGNSFLTLAATKSRDGAGGCFSVLDQRYQPAKMSGHSQDGSPYAIYVRRQLPHWGLAISAEMDPCPLLTRGWVFQERFLAPRVLHFGTHELRWECMQMSACECDAVKAVSQVNNPKADYVFWLKQPKNTVQTAWRHMVKDFSSLTLTYESDLFPALSGLVKQMQQYRQDRYLAGLWEDSLIEDLLWCIPIVSRGYSHRPLKWRAPSWSWASVRNVVTYNEDAKAAAVYCKILETDCTPGGPDTTGELLSAYLKMSACVMPAILRYKSDNNGQYTGRFEVEFSSGRPFRRLSLEADYCLSDEGDGYIADGRIIHCVKVAELLIWKYFLVLRNVDDKEKVYERIGITSQFKDPIEKDPIVGIEESTFTII